MNNNQAIAIFIFDSDNFQWVSVMIKADKKTLWRRIIYHNITLKMQQAKKNALFCYAMFICAIKNNNLHNIIFIYPFLQVKVPQPLIDTKKQEEYTLATLTGFSGSGESF